MYQKIEHYNNSQVLEDDFQKDLIASNTDDEYKNRGTDVTKLIKVFHGKQSNFAVIFTTVALHIIYLSSVKT